MTKPSPGGFREPQASSAFGVEGAAKSGYSSKVTIWRGTGGCEYESGGYGEAVLHVSPTFGRERELLERLVIAGYEATEREAEGECIQAEQAQQYAHSDEPPSQPRY